MSATGRDAINIRRMTRSDIDAIIILVNKITTPKTHVAYKDLAAYDFGGPLDFSLVAEAEGQIIGFIIACLEYVYIPFTEVCLIQAIVVDPEHQHHHVGSVLVKELASRCHLQDINTLRALSRHGDDKVRSFLDDLGFHRSNISNWDKTFETWVD
jgi:N-acetylglutamate synthase-like GNAT family acetyltransferase